MELTTSLTIKRTS